MCCEPVIQIVLYKWDKMVMTALLLTPSLIFKALVTMLGGSRAPAAHYFSSWVSSNMDINHKPISAFRSHSCSLKACNKAYGRLPVHAVCQEKQSWGLPTSDRRFCFVFKKRKLPKLHPVTWDWLSPQEENTHTKKRSWPTLVWSKQKGVALLSGR